MNTMDGNFEYCDKCSSFDCKCKSLGSRRYSGSKDHQIGEYGRNGMTHERTESDFSDQEKAENGLTLREKL